MKLKGRRDSFKSQGGLLSLSHLLFRFTWPSLWQVVGWLLRRIPCSEHQRSLCILLDWVSPGSLGRRGCFSRVIHLSAVLTLWEACPENTYLFPLTSRWLAEVETFTSGQRVLPWWINRPLNLMCECQKYTHWDARFRIPDLKVFWCVLYWGLRQYAWHWFNFRLSFSLGIFPTSCHVYFTTPQILFTYTCFLSGIFGMTWDCTEVLRGLFSSSLLSF